MADITDTQAEKLIKLYTKAEKDILAEVNNNSNNETLCPAMFHRGWSG